MQRATAFLALAALACLFWLSIATPVAYLAHWTDGCDGTLNPNIVPNPQVFNACNPAGNGNSVAFTCDGVVARSVTYATEDCSGSQTGTSQTVVDRCLNFGNGVFQRWTCYTPPVAPVAPVFVPVPVPVPVPVAPIAPVALPPIVAYLTYWTDCDATLNTAISPNPVPIRACMPGAPSTATGSTSYACDGSSLTFLYFPTSDCSGRQCAAGSCGGYGFVNTCTGTNGNWQKYTCSYPALPPPVAPIAPIAPVAPTIVAYLTYWTDCDATLNTAISPNPVPIYSCMPGAPSSVNGSTSYACDGSSLTFLYFPTSDCSGRQCAAGSCGGYGFVNTCTGSNGNWQKYTCSYPTLPPPVAPIAPIAPVAPTIVAYLTYWVDCDATLNTAISPNPVPIYSCMPGAPSTVNGSTSYACDGSSLTFLYFPTSDCSGRQCAAGSCGGYGFVDTCTGTNGNWQKYTCSNPFPPVSTPLALPSPPAPVAPAIPSAPSSDEPSGPIAVSPDAIPSVVLAPIEDSPSTTNSPDSPSVTPDATDTPSDTPSVPTSAGAVAYPSLAFSALFFTAIVLALY